MLLSRVAADGGSVDLVVESSVLHCPHDHGHRGGRRLVVEQRHECVQRHESVPRNGVPSIDQLGQRYDPRLQCDHCRQRNAHRSSMGYDTLLRDFRRIPLVGGSCWTVRVHVDLVLASARRRVCTLAVDRVFVQLLVDGASPCTYTRHTGTEHGTCAFSHTPTHPRDTTLRPLN